MIIKNIFPTIKKPEMVNNGTIPLVPPVARCK
jgi:hypothetical protein